MSCAHRCTTGEGREYQREWAQGVPLLVRRGLSVVQDKNPGVKPKRAVYDVAPQHGQVVIGNCHVPHGRRVKEFVAQLREQYVRAMHRGRLVVVGDFNSDPRGKTAETEVEPAQEGITASRIDAVYADPRWVRGVTAGYMVGPEEMQDTRGRCPMMVIVGVRRGGQGTTCTGNVSPKRRGSTCRRPCSG